MSDDLAERVASQLAEAHRRVRQLAAEDDEKARATRRLLAIGDASKHDLERAARRLEAFLRDLDEGRIATSAGEDAV